MLLGYDFFIEFKSVHTNKVVDALCRCGIENEAVALAVISFPTLVWLQELKQAYLKDPIVQNLFVKFQHNSSSTLLFSLKHVLFRKEKKNLYLN